MNHDAATNRAIRAAHAQALADMQAREDWQDAVEERVNALTKPGQEYDPFAPDHVLEALGNPEDADQKAFVAKFEDDIRKERFEAAGRAAWLQAWAYWQRRAEEKVCQEMGATQAWEEY